MKRGIGILAMMIVAIAVANTTVTGCRKKPAGSDTGAAPAAESPAVQEWEVIARGQADLPELDRHALLKRVRKWVEAAHTLPSWEAHYEAGFTQVSPPVREMARVRMVSAGRKWAVHLLTNADDGQQMQTWRAACDGNTVCLIWPDSKQAQLLRASEQVGFGSAPMLPAFLPQLPSEDALRCGVDLRDMLTMLDDPEVRLSPSCTRVDGNPCYVLERTKTSEYPVFQSRQQADQWREEHPDEEISADGSVRPLVVIDPHAKPGQKVTRTVTMRLAVDPKLGFAIVRWARGLDMHMLGRPISVFPDMEAVYHDFQKVAEALYLPRRMEFNIYHQTISGRPELFQRFTLAVEDIIVQPQCEAGLFEPAIPEGYAVADGARGIAYTAGESQEKLDILIAGAEARDAFYHRLQEGPAPSLEALMWIVDEPIDLAEHRGRPIILHFWGIDCAPCTHELLRLQDQHGNTMHNKREPLFVSIHPYVEGAELEKVQQVVRQKGITFPVMIDAPYTGELSWGRTFQKYRIFGIPSEIRIDESGRVGEIEKELVSEDSWWIGKGQAK
jgi:peroxiredoxin